MASTGATPKLKMISGFPKGTRVIAECEVTAEGDDLETRYGNCKKNPGHSSFIPVGDIKLSHLPLEHQTPKMMQTIKELCDLTVKITVRFVSKDRPDTFADKDEPYPFCDKRGSRRIRRFGSGFVKIIGSEDESHVWDKPCPCQECKNSDEPKMEYWTLLVSTATHVIFDDSEAEHSIFECFFDSENRDNVKLLYGQSLKSKKLDFDKYQSDTCCVNCVTHDKELWIQLEKLCSNYNFTFNMGGCLSTFAYLISHPHGCSKRITFGAVDHITVPIDEEYPTCLSVMFERGTTCRLPLYPWSKESEKNSHSKPKNKSNPSSIPKDLNSIDNDNPESENRSVSGVEKECETPTKPLTTSLVQSMDGIENNAETCSMALDENKELNPRILQSDQELISLLTSSAISGKDSSPHMDAPTADLDFEYHERSSISKSDFDIPILKPAENRQENEDFSEGLGIDFSSFSSVYPQILSLPQDVTITLPPEMLYALDPSRYSTKFCLKPGTEINIPFGTTFTLPTDADYALRFASLQKPTWFTLPIGTKFTLPKGRDIFLPPESEFSSPGLKIRFAYVTYNIDSCPGSSGSIVHQHGDSMMLPFSIFNFSHFGAINQEGKNRSGVQNLYLGL